MPLLHKIISGGQAGVDRAALDYAISVGMPHGGNVPLGFWAEDGGIDRERYSGLVDSGVADPDVRTEQNVRESDGTLVITKGPPDRGTALTIRLAAERQKPHALVDLSQISLPNAIQAVRSFLDDHPIKTLNIAGPRESQVPGGIYHQAFGLLAAALTPVATTHGAADAIQVACHLHSEALTNFRHWDSIRWNSVAWLFSLVSALVAILALMKPTNPLAFAGVFFGCGMLGVVEFILLWNLVKYHRASMAEMNQHIEKLVGNGPIADALQKQLPFSFDGGAWKTATAWLLVIVGIAVGGCAVATILLLRQGI